MQLQWNYTKPSLWVSLLPVDITGLRAGDAQHPRVRTPPCASRFRLTRYPLGLRPRDSGVISPNAVPPIGSKENDPELRIGYCGRGFKGYASNCRCKFTRSLCRLCYAYSIMISIQGEGLSRRKWEALPRSQAKWIAMWRLSTSASRRRDRSPSRCRSKPLGTRLHLSLTPGYTAFIAVDGGTNDRINAYFESC